MRHRWWMACVLASFIAWDYAAHPHLAFFLIFVHGEGQAYNFDEPLWPVDVMSDGLVTQVACTRLPLVGPGPWFAVVLAGGRDGERSQPSNEVRFFWSPTLGCTPDAVPGVPPRPSPPVTPPVVGVPPVAKPPSLSELFPPVVLPPLKFPPPTGAPKTGGSLDDLVESCAWRGCKAPPAPPMTAPGPDLIDHPKWRGRR